MTDYAVEYVGTLAISWLLLWIVARLTRTSFRRLYSDPLLWVSLMAGVAIAMGL